MPAPAAAPADAPAATPAPAAAPAPAAPTPAATPTAAPQAETSANLKTLTGVPCKWKYAKSSDTAIAFLDGPKGRNQAFVIGKDDAIQAELLKIADTGVTVEIKGDYKSDTPVAVFIVSSITPVVTKK